MKILRQPVIYFAAVILALMLVGSWIATPPTKTPLPTQETPTVAIKATATQSPVLTVLPIITVSTNTRSQETERANHAATQNIAYVTQQVFKAKISTFPKACENVSFERLSTDEKWLILVCMHGRLKEKMVVENRNGMKWEIKFEDILGEEAKVESIPSPSLYPLHWSADGNYLYFAGYAGMEGGGTCFYGFGAQGLFRLDLQSGKVSTILALLSQTESGYEIAFSPTGRRFSYSQGYAEGANNFHLVDLLTGQETIFPTEELNGNFTWSPDGEMLAYSTSRCDLNVMVSVHSFIKVLTIADLSTKTIAQSDTDFLTIKDWSADYLINIDSLSYLTYETKSLSLNPEKSIVISSATATP